MLSLKRKWKWFVADAIEDTIPVQDTIHEGAKLRVRLLKRERFKFLPLGNTIASCTHFSLGPLKFRNKKMRIRDTKLIIAELFQL